MLGQVGTAAQGKFGGNKACFEGFAETNVIRDQEPHTVMGQSALNWQMLEGQIVDSSLAESEWPTCCGRRRPERGCEVQLRIDQSGGCVGDQANRRRIKDARTFFKIPNEPGFLVPDKTRYSATVDLPKPALQVGCAKHLPSG